MMKSLNKDIVKFSRAKSRTGYKVYGNLAYCMMNQRYENARQKKVQ